MQKIKPIITEVGKIWGRDAIFLSSVNVINESTFEIKGEFNGKLCSLLNDNKDRNYRIIFKKVLLFKMIELDFDEVEYASSFDEVENSFQLAQMLYDDKTKHIGKIDKNFRHFVFRTYDTVFEIIGKEFELTLE